MLDRSITIREIRNWDLFLYRSFEILLFYILVAIDLSRDEPQIHFDTVATRAGLEIVEAVRLPRLP